MPSPLTPGTRTIRMCSFDDRSGTNTAPFQERGKRAWKDHFYQPLVWACLSEQPRSSCFYFLSLARLEGMWTEAFDMASAIFR